MTTIIIPAHNEEKVIERCLRPFIDIVKHKDFEVIVVCNGCTDQTARKVYELGKDFICIETEEPSKSNALNIGDEIASSFPRFYLDADVYLPMEAISAVSRLLDSGYLAAAPEVRMNLSESSWFVCAYYKVWMSLPYCKAGMIGAGVYALSRKGRERFSNFPDIIADDGYVRRLFNEPERGVAQGVYSIVNAPKHVEALIRIKTRSRLGVYQLEERYPEIRDNEKKDYGKAARNLILDIKLLPQIIVYLLINIVARVRASMQMKKGMLIWERDESSR